MGKINKYVIIIIIIFLILPLLCLSSGENELHKHFHKNPKNNYVNLNLTCRRILLNQSLLNSINILFNINIVSHSLVQSVRNEFFNTLIFLNIEIIRPPPFIPCIQFSVTDIQPGLHRMM